MEKQKDCIDLEKIESYNLLNNLYLEKLNKVLEKVDDLLETFQDNRLALIQESEDISQHLQTLNSSQSNTDDKNKIKQFMGFKSCYITDKNHKIPPKNVDVTLRESLNVVSANNVQRSRWCNEDFNTMIKLIETAVVKNKCEPLIKKKEKLLDTFDMDDKKNAVTKEEITAISKSLKEIDEAIKSLSESPVSLQSLEDLDGNNNIDWLMISTIIGNKSSKQCKRLWDLYLKPSINKKEWDDKENETLEELVRKYGMHDWQTISQELGTKRKPYQCLAQYQKHLKDESNGWTLAEDQKLKELVSEYKVGQRILWNHVFKYFPHKNYVQMVKHYKRSVDPEIKSGKWDEREDKLLLDAVDKCGMVWSKVSQLLPSRNEAQCMNRYQNILNPTLKFGSWNCVEDARILKFVKTHGFVWSKLTALLPSRSDNQVLSRCGILLRIKRCNTDSKEKMEECLKLLEQELTPLYDAYMRTHEEEAKNPRKTLVTQNSTLSTRDTKPADHPDENNNQNIEPKNDTIDDFDLKWNLLGPDTNPSLGYLDFGKVDEDVLARIIKKFRLNNRGRFRTRVITCKRTKKRRKYTHRKKLETAMNPGDFRLVQYFKKQIFQDLYNSNSTKRYFNDKVNADNANLMVRPMLTEKHQDQFNEEYNEIYGVIQQIVNRDIKIVPNPSTDNTITKFLDHHSFLPPYKENMIAWANLLYLKLSLETNARHLGNSVSLEEVDEPGTSLEYIQKEVSTGSSNIINIGGNVLTPILLNPIDHVMPMDLNLQNLNVKAIPLSSGSLIKAAYKIKIKRKFDYSPFNPKEGGGSRMLPPCLDAESRLILPQAIVPYASFLPSSRPESNLTSTNANSYFRASSLKEPIQISAILNGLERQQPLSASTIKPAIHIKPTASQASRDERIKNAHRNKVDYPLQIAKQTKEYAALKSYLRSILLYPAILTQAPLNKDN
ncbi:unnamed protein product [Gordionus sp. m RMFG-2023]|uniref:uncharacterized protein LOC135931345 n=1 Tax=Gordionus sp. m RMFG-2023 TaxID=3053472 RepID=UPI0030E2F85A